MSRWPPYDVVREGLLQEVIAEYRPDKLTTEDLLGKLAELREEFWQIGGNLSATAWKSGYKAKILADIAAAKAPTDLVVIDELVEVLQDVTPIYRYDAQRQTHVPNEDVRQSIKQLRQKQYDQMKQEIAQGRTPELMDFVRAADLLYLVGPDRVHR